MNPLCKNIGTDLPGSGAIGNYMRVRYMGPNTVYADGVGRFPPQGGPQADGTANAEGEWWSLVLPPAAGCDGGVGVVGGGYLSILLPEQSGAIYCDYANYNPVSGSKSSTRAKGIHAVVGIGGSGF